MTKNNSHTVKNVLIFTSSLGWGGAETHLVRIANELDKLNCKVQVAVVDGGGVNEQFLNSNISLLVFNRSKSLESYGNLMMSVFYLRRKIQEINPQVIYSVMDHANVFALLAILGLKTKPISVISVQNTPSKKYFFDRRLTSRLTLRLMKLLYRKASAVVASSEGVQHDLNKLIPSTLKNTRVIYNAGYDDNVIRLSKDIAKNITRNISIVVACGRLIYQKGFSYLLQAMNIVNKTRSVKLFIIGDGPEKASLLSLASELNILDRVVITGFVENPYQFMAQADVFVLSSIFEGCSNVIAEAMSIGVPVISTDCPYGPGELIDIGENGMLVPMENAQAIANAILYLLENPIFAAILSEKARSSVKKRHSTYIANQYYELFNALWNREGSKAII
ncbi:MAG TPA: glycosyltransferase [Bacteroidia bacterium]|nr:glycosyltransferase [Bacteroidia bacterium]